jgi:hypothetical protein
VLSGTRRLYLIGTKAPAGYDEAIALLADLRELARRDGQAGEFARRFAALCEDIPAQARPDRPPRPSLGSSPASDG